MKNLSLTAAFLLLGIAASGQVSADFTSKTRVCSGTPFTLTSNCTDANAYHWLIDGDSYAHSQDTAAIFFTNCAVSHTVSLVAINTVSGTSDTFTKNISAISLTCSGQFGTDYTGCYGDTFTYYSHNDAVANLWSFSEAQEIIDGCDTCDHVTYLLTAEGLDIFNTITYDGGCQDIIAYNHTLCPDGWLSVGEVEEGDAITIAPNPISGRATLKFHNTTGKRHTFMLYNIEGRIVRRVENITGSELELSRDGLSAGSYFYTLSSADGATARGKVFIQ